MEKKELEKILHRHKGWRLNKKWGKRADLHGANLQGANLWDADLKGANLKGADLWGADLKGADLWGADLKGANLWCANLHGANLKGANLWCANLKGANLKGANLWCANLHGANLQGANLWGADLKGANLWCAYSIYSFGPIGQDKRIGYAISHGEKIMFKLGCFWGTHDEAVQAVRVKYGENSVYEKNLDLAVEVLNGL